MASPPFAFYLPEDPDFTILDAAIASVRYALTVCDDPGDGTLRCRSVTTLPDGTLARYRGRLLEGVGYCADSVFAANQLIRFGRLMDNHEIDAAGTRLARHSLQQGFFEDPTIPVRLYRDTETGEFLDNLEAHPEYLELGHIARVGHQLVGLHSLLDAEAVDSTRAIAGRLVTWLGQVERCANGWFPRRCTPDGTVYSEAPDSFGPTQLNGPFPRDPIFDRSGSGCLIIQFLVEVQRLGWGDCEPMIRSVIKAFMDAGGHFGSTNTDTEDLHENVSYALAFLALQSAASTLGEPEWSDFAYDQCLRPLEQFELVEDLNGLHTKGLLYMERSWNAACLWEIAMAAQAYLVALRDRGERAHGVKALTMLRAMAKHHHGEYGFLTEAVDWDGHSVATRHFDGAQFSDINETHPFLNNLHVLEPTTYYLEHFAEKRQDAVIGVESLFDLEGNRLGPASLEVLPWGQS